MNCVVDDQVFQFQDIDFDKDYDYSVPNQNIPNQHQSVNIKKVITEWTLKHAICCLATKCFLL